MNSRLKSFGKVFRKAACIFDDAAIPLQGLVPVIGPLILCVAGYIIFSLEAYFSFTGLLKAWRKSDADETKIGSVLAHLEQFLFAILGLLVTTALAVITITLLIVAVKALAGLAAIFSIAIPATMAVMEGIEWAESLNTRMCARTPADIEKTNRKLFFNSIFLGISVTVAVLAALAVLTGGLAPSLAVIGIILVSVSIKVFEMWDKKNGYANCNAIRDWFARHFCCRPERPVPENSLTLTDVQVKNALHRDQPVMPLPASSCLSTELRSGDASGGSLEGDSIPLQHTYDSQTHDHQVSLDLSPRFG